MKKSATIPLTVLLLGLIVVAFVRQAAPNLGNRTELNASLTVSPDSYAPGGSCTADTLSCSVDEAAVADFPARAENLPGPSVPTSWGIQPGQWYTVPTQAVCENRNEEPSVRWSLQTDGESALIAVSQPDNTESKHLQFHLSRTDGSKDHFPKRPFDVGAGQEFTLPYRVEFHGVTVRYAMAEPLATLEGRRNCLAFAEIPGVEPEVCANGRIYRHGVNYTIHLKNRQAENIVLCVLDAESARKAVKLSVPGQEFLVIPREATALVDGDILRLDRNAGSEEDAAWHMNIFPGGLPLDSLFQKSTDGKGKDDPNLGKVIRLGHRKGLVSASDSLELLLRK